MTTQPLPNDFHEAFQEFKRMTAEIPDDECENQNPGCDSCGMFDRIDGSRYCSDCKEEQDDLNHIDDLMPLYGHCLLCGNISIVNNAKEVCPHCGKTQARNDIHADLQGLVGNEGTLL